MPNLDRKGSRYSPSEISYINIKMFMAIIVIVTIGNLLVGFISFIGIILSINKFCLNDMETRFHMQEMQFVSESIFAYIFS
jgi:hypothetical protein